MKKIESDSKEFKQKCLDVLLAYAPYIIQCQDCGNPTLEGYCCTYCGSTDPGENEVDLHYLFSGQLEGEF